MPTKLIRRCAWCGDVESNGSWRRPPAALSPDDVTHGICERCFSRQPGATRREVEPHASFVGTTARRCPA